MAFSHVMHLSDISPLVHAAHLQEALVWLVRRTWYTAQ
jgi:hypothetical protein